MAFIIEIEIVSGRKSICDANHHQLIMNIQRGRLAITESEQCTFNNDLLRVEELVTGVVGQEHDEARETVGAYGRI